MAIGDWKQMSIDIMTIYYACGVHIVHDPWMYLYTIRTSKYIIDLSAISGDIAVYFLDANHMSKEDATRYHIYDLPRSNIGLDSFCQVDSEGNPIYCDENMINNMVDRLAKLKAFV